MSDINSKGLIYIDYSGGNHQLFRVKSIDFDDDKDTEVVTVAGVDDGAGFRNKPGGGSMTLEVYRESPTPEVNWRRLKTTKERFTITVQDEDGGPREQYQVCRVANVKRKLDDGGNNMDTVKLVYLRGPIEMPKKAA